jgi:prepilin-type N-terminal cleavage/methylation domain-containing protein
MRIIKQQKGFTLIELLLVITAIGIFSAIGLVALNPNKQLEAGRAVKRKADMDVIAKAIEQYVVNNRGKYPPALQSVVTGGTVGLCVTSPCTGGIDLTTDLAPYIAAIPLPQTGQYTITKTATGITPGYDSSTIWATAGTTAPKLDLNFARDKQLVNAVNGSNPITFTRNSIGTYVGSDGLIKTAAVNEPRFDYDPVTKSSLGLLVEEGRTNLRTYSDAISVANGYSVTNASLTTVSTSTPISGMTNATLVTLNVGANPGNTQEGFNYGSGLTLSNTTKYTQSVFVKLAGSNVLRLRSNVTGLVVDFILTGNGTAPTTSSELQGASITPVGNGWYRVIWTFTTTTTAPGNRADFWAIKPDIANGISGIYVVGAQLEQGAFATSYIPTTTAAATRAADEASITGSNFTSGWYNQAASTWFSQFSPIYTATAAIPSNTPHIFQVYNTAINQNNYASRGAINGTSFLGVARNPNPILLFPGRTFNYLVGNNIYKAVYAINSSDLIVGINGNIGTITTNTAATGMATHDRLDIGSGTGGTPPYALNGIISRLTYWNTRLSNTTLTNITK